MRFSLVGVSDRFLFTSFFTFFFFFYLILLYNNSGSQLVVFLSTFKRLFPNETLLLLQYQCFICLDVDVRARFVLARAQLYLIFFPKLISSLASITLKTRLSRVLNAFAVCACSRQSARLYGLTHASPRCERDSTMPPS
jgi:hypothetical protein